MKTVYNALNPHLKIDGCKYWLDSKTALFWIKNKGEWPQFVQHRVNEILRITKKEDWEHCAGVRNPADLGSRGVSASTLLGSRLWWKAHIGYPWEGNIGLVNFLYKNPRRYVLKRRK